MKKLLINILLGFLVFVLILICEAAVTMPFGDPQEGKLTMYLTYEFLLTAIPAGLVTFILALVSRTKTKAEALAKSLIWTAVVVLLYFVIAFFNDNIQPVFGNFAFYVLLVCVFAGPMIYAKSKKIF
ncbi:MAG: hypothetical protein AB9844_12380 [Clostridiaceae bacterium]